VSRDEEALRRVDSHSPFLNETRPRMVERSENALVSLYARAKFAEMEKAVVKVIRV